MFIMKKLLIISTLILVSPLWGDGRGAAQALKIDKLDSKYGFKSIKFEESYENIKHLLDPAPVKENAKDKQKTYIVKDSTFRYVGRNEIEKVTVSFFNDKLWKIKIETAGMGNTKGFLEVLKTAYGNGQKLSTDRENYKWAGKKLTMEYDVNPNNKARSITTLFSLKMDKLLNDWINNVSPDAVDDL